MYFVPGEKSVVHFLISYTHDMNLWLVEGRGGQHISKGIFLGVKQFKDRLYFGCYGQFVYATYYWRIYYRSYLSMSDN